HQRGFAAEVLPVLVEHRIGVLAMKALGGGAILASETVSAIACLHYAMNLPTSVVINGCDSMERLQQGLNAARTCRPMSKSQTETLLRQTAMAGKSGRYEPFKSPLHLDGTGFNPEWLA
ncbi:MAG: aldo/keto reductase, partial [Terriglobia bacterium]